MDTLITQLRNMNVGGEEWTVERLRDLLEELGILNPSSTRLQRLFKRLEVFKCAGCTLHFASFLTLRSHIRDTVTAGHSHCYSSVRLLADKRAVINQIRNDQPELGITVWGDICPHYDNLLPHLQHSYDETLGIQLVLQYLKRQRSIGN